MDKQCSKCGKKYNDYTDPRYSNFMAITLKHEYFYFRHLHLCLECYQKEEKSIPSQVKKSIQEQLNSLNCSEILNSVLGTYEKLYLYVRPKIKRINETYLCLFSIYYTCVMIRKSISLRDCCDLNGVSYRAAYEHQAKVYGLHVNRNGRKNARKTLLAFIEAL